MTTPFDNLDKEKQERILSAAMKEFASKGYDNASTNEIVKEANIGKGRLFSYFNTKKELFLFLFDYTYQIVKKDYYDQIDTLEKDFLKRLHQVTVLKTEVYKMHPWLFDFAKVAFFTTSEQVKEDITKKAKEFTSVAYDNLFADIDTSLFKEGADVKKSINLIAWAVQGYGNQLMENMKSVSDFKDLDTNEILKEFDGYLEILRKNFYKEQN